MTISTTNTAFVFPGQGSQKVGMLADLAAQYDEIKQTFQQASDVLGYDLWALAQAGPQDKLNLTEITQPLLLTSSLAIWRTWRAGGGAIPALVAGHSLGEYSALVCSGVIAFEEAVDLVRQRGRFMQDAVPVGTGAMSAVIGLDDAEVVNICTDMSSADAVVEAVNFNSPGQVVVAGHAQAVEAAGEKLKQAGAKRVAPLPVSAPFHTSLMRPAGEALSEAMSSMTFMPPQIPVVHNVHAQTESSPDAIRELMIRQTSVPVQWTGCVKYMVDHGIERTLECGPGKVLSGLSRRIHKPLQVLALESPDAIASELGSSS